MLSASAALQKAADVTSWATGMCDNFVANMYGFSSSGYSTAISHWNSIPTMDKHPGDMNAPQGALMFWGGNLGHVAISDGNGGIYTTDMPTDGTVSHQSASVITSKWGKPYLGWTVPYFQGQAGSVGAAGTGTTGADASDTEQAGLTSDLFGGILSALGINFTDLAERAGLIALGTALLVIGIWKFTNAQSAAKSISGTVGGLTGAKKAGAKEVNEDVTEETGE